MVVMAAISFVVAAFSWWFVERPFRRAQLGTHQTLRRYAFASAIALAFPVAIRMGDGLPFRLSDETKQLETIAAGPRGVFERRLTSAADGGKLCGGPLSAA